MSYDACKVMISHSPSNVKRFIVRIPIYPFRIVGDDDGGNLFTPDEYEEYKKKVLPLRIANRLFVSWTAPNGMDCKLVGPETMCFCNHRYIYYLLFISRFVHTKYTGVRTKGHSIPNKVQPPHPTPCCYRIYIITNPTTLSLPSKKNLLDISKP